jgi:hypothetical protein
MSLFEMTTGARYVKVIFNANELNVIRTACASVSANEHEKMNNLADADLEQAADMAKRASDSRMADRLVSFFKAGQKILIEREDLEPVLECLRTYGQSAPQEHAGATKGVIEKIERDCRRD